MRFSEEFQVLPTDRDDWFDTLLIEDTPLYVDPFLIYDDTDEFWARAHDDLMDFFAMVLHVVKESNGQTSSLAWKKAANILIFHEPSEFCLGLAKGHSNGSGPGKKLAEPMLAGALAAVQDNIEHVTHIEELILLSEGMGFDRVSDLTCNVLKAYFVQYTQQVCRQHGIPMRRQRLRNSSWDDVNIRWRDEEIELPYNQYQDAPILLCPRRFLKEMMTVDSPDFWDWAWSNSTEDLRTDFNYDAGRKVPAKLRARLARERPEVLRAYLHAKEESDKKPYDFEGDPLWLVTPYEEGQELAERSPLSFIPSQRAEFDRFVRTVIESFKHSIEDSDAWRLLWVQNRFRNEASVQQLFKSTVIHYCRANGIDLSAESNAGRGPVDFKFAQSLNARALIEVKLASNTKFWDGLTRQTVQYLKSEEIDTGYFVYVIHHSKHDDPELRKRARDLAEEASKESGRTIHVVEIDARPKKSASKLTSGSSSSVDQTEADMSTEQAD